MISIVMPQENIYKPGLSNSRFTINIQERLYLNILTKQRRLVGANSYNIILSLRTSLVWTISIIQSNPILQNL